MRQTARRVAAHHAPSQTRRFGRRPFVLGALATAGALAAGGWSGPARASAPLGPRLGARRSATFRALVTTLQQAPDARFAHADPAAGARGFARWYARQPAPVRGHVDTVLDELAAGGRLRYAALARPPAPAGGDDEARRCAVVAAAVALAAGLCDPPPPGAELGAVAAPAVLA